MNFIPKFRLMKKIFPLIISAAIFFGCEKDYSGIVTTSNQTFQVIGLGAVGDIIYNPSEPDVTLSVQFSSSTSIVNVYANIADFNNKNVNSKPINFYDDGNSVNGDAVKGDNSFSAKYSMPNNLSNGRYSIDYFVIKTNSSTEKIAAQSFNFDNGSNNVAPTVSNLTVPDTVTISSDTVYIKITLAASDSNGYDDIEKVFFNSFLPPDGKPSSSNPILLFDDGSNGDAVPHDGVYTRTVILPPVGVTRGIYRWEFQAKDRGKKTSNVIVHNLLVR